MNRRQPFSGVASSTAIQTVQVASGRIGQYSPSWCHGVAWPLTAGLAKKLEFHRAKSGPRICSTRSSTSGMRAWLRNERSNARAFGQ